MGIPGLIEEFNKLSENFLSLSDDEKRVTLEKAEKLIESFDSKADVANGKQYAKIMSNVISKGTEYITKEIERLRGILGSERVSESKKSDVQLRLNIINSFDRTIVKTVYSQTNEL